MSGKILSAARSNFKPSLESRFRVLLERHGISLPNSRGLVRCLFHPDKTPSLSIDVERGLFHCFSCGIGGGVKDFALVVGEPWETTRHISASPAAKRKATLHSLALAAAKREYRAWQRKTLCDLANQYRNLCEERAVAEVEYRAIHRNPHLYTEDARRFWTYRLAAIYDRLAVLENDLDLLTYNVNEPARFGWWRQESEVSHGRI